MTADKTSTRLATEAICNDYIVGSRASLEKKVAAFRKIPPNKETDALINAAETALAEKAKSPNDVFLATLHFPYETGDMDTWEERKPFLSFEAVIHDMHVVRYNEIAYQYDEYLYSDDYERHEGHLGCSWDEFRERFGL